MACGGSLCHICVIDFEATCVEGGFKDFYPHEIIEFPAILVHINKCEIISTFHSFVRPIVNPHLSEFCKDLTGITQASVDAAETFPYVLSRFLDWIKEMLPEGSTFKILTDGVWDIDKFLSLQCHISQIEFPLWANQYVDIKRSYRYYNKRAQKYKLMDMLQAYGLKFVGRLHSGKDDAYNIAQLALTMLKKGFHLKLNSVRSVSSADYLERKMNVYYKERRKERLLRGKSARKEITQPGPSREVQDESAMDIDPDVIGSEYVLLKHKKK